MTDDDIIELFEERVSIILEGCPAFSLGNTISEHEKQARRQAYFDVKRTHHILIMPHSTRPDGFDRVKRNKGPSPDNLNLWSNDDAS